MRRLATRIRTPQLPAAAWRRYSNDPRLRLPQQSDDIEYVDFKTMPTANQLTLQPTISAPSARDIVIEAAASVSTTAEEAVARASLLSHSEVAELEHEDFIAYDGYAPPRLRVLKRLVMSIAPDGSDNGFTQPGLFDSNAVIMAEAKQHAADLIAARDEIRRDVLPALMAQFNAAENVNAGIVTVRDVNHARFVLAIACRRTGEIAEAEALMTEMLRDAPGDSDAIEGLLELCVDHEDHIKTKLRPFFDWLAALRASPDAVAAARRSAALRVLREAEDEERRLGRPGAITAEELRLAEAEAQADVDADDAPLSRSLMLATVSLSDILLSSTAEVLLKDGEGAAQKHFFKSLALLARALGPEHTHQLLVRVLDAVTEQAATADALASNSGTTLHVPASLSTAQQARELGKEKASPYITSAMILDRKNFIFSPDAATHRERRAEFNRKLVVTVVRVIIAKRLFGVASGIDVTLNQLQREHEAATMLSNTLLPATGAQRGEDTTTVTSSGNGAVNDPSSMAATTTVVRDRRDIELLQQRAKDSVLMLEFTLMSLLCFTLRALGRQSDSFQAGERAVAFYERHEALLRDEHEERYKLIILQLAHDRARAPHTRHLGKQACVRIIERYPTLSTPWRILALVFYHEKQIDDAVIAAKKAMEVDPDDVAAVLLLANLYKASRRFVLADEVLDRYYLLTNLVRRRAEAERMANVYDDNPAAASAAAAAISAAATEIPSMLGNDEEDGAEGEGGAGKRSADETESPGQRILRRHARQLGAMRDQVYAELDIMDTQLLPKEAEPNQIDVQFAEMREHMDRYNAAHTYSKPTVTRAHSEHARREATQELLTGDAKERLALVGMPPSAGYADATMGSVPAPPDRQP